MCKYLSEILLSIFLDIYLEVGLLDHMIILFFFEFYLFIHERQRWGSRDIGRERSRLHAGSPMWDSIPGLQDHALSRRQAPNC